MSNKTDIIISLLRSISNKLKPSTPDNPIEPSTGTYTITDSILITLDTVYDGYLALQSCKIENGYLILD